MRLEVRDMAERERERLETDSLDLKQKGNGKLDSD